MVWYFCDVLHLNQNFLMKCGTGFDAVLRDNRKVVSSIDSFVFSVFSLFAALVSEAVFLCPSNSYGPAPTDHLRLFWPSSLISVNL